MGFYFVKFKSSNYPKASEILKRHKETFDQYQTKKLMSAGEIPYLIVCP